MKNDEIRGILDIVIKKAMDRGIQLGLDNAHKRIKVTVDMTDIRKEALSRLKSLYKIDEGEIDIIIANFLVKWINEDKQDMGIGTFRRKDLAHAISKKLMGE